MDYTDYIGEPLVILPGSQFSTTTCTDTASGTLCITEYPYNFHVQDAGNVSFGISVIITILTIALATYFFNLFYPKKTV